MKNQFAGTGVALVTPFHKYGTIDFSSLERVVDHVIKGKVDYLVVMGTTGESATLSVDEKNAVLDFVIETTNNKIPIVRGIGGNNTQEIIDQIKTESFEGISGILSVCPYYNKPQQKGIYQHYKAIASATSLPVILYNVPGRTGTNIDANTTLELAHEIDNIVAIKEASGNFDQISKILKDKPQDFSVISGDDGLTVPMMAIGAAGVISVTANAFPGEFSKMVNLCSQGDFMEASKIHFALHDIMEALFEDGSPSGIKAALQILDISQNNLRLPIVKINKSLYIKLNTLITEYSESKIKKVK
ncbi:MAG: 4-hydroxy-tetrahydrodipicolinate synthase [Bacteroidales bacterium]|nr:4-hydroxy-tetrahydrodipicolinate synthase [Bacteroidales bacterium]